MIETVNVMMSSDSRLERFDLHLGESQRVIAAFPVIPVHTDTGRGVSAIQVTTVEVGLMTALVPPGTTVQICT